jgi:adenylosuccinate lyase
MPRVTSFFMDQISEHQRDLTNSASQRFIADYIAGFTLAVSRMEEVVRSLGVDRQRLAANLNGSADGSADGKTAGGGIPGGILAEPAYILLAESGQSDAHEVIRKITLAAEKESLSFAGALAKEKETLSAIGGKMAELGIIGADQEAISKSEIDEAALRWFKNPQQYRGLSVKKARSLAEKYRELMRRQ